MKSLTEAVEGEEIKILLKRGEESYIVQVAKATKDYLGVRVSTKRGFKRKRIYFENPKLYGGEVIGYEPYVPRKQD